MSNQPICRCTLCGVALFASEVRILEVQGKSKKPQKYAVCLDKAACDQRRKAQAVEATPQPDVNAPDRQAAT